MRHRISRYVAAGLCAGLLGLPATSTGQTYRQQGIYPVFDGWEELPDGSKLIYFGYMNRHAVEITIPLGPGNMFEQPPADRNQPTHFLPGRNEHVFTVKVPKSFTGKLIWTLKSGVGVQKAIASLDQLYILEVEQEEPGEKMEPPRIKAADASVKLADALHLAPQVHAEAAKREQVIEGSGARQSGLAVLWNKHRGPGNVTFTAEPGARPAPRPAPNPRGRPEAPPVPGVFSATCTLPAGPGCGAVAAHFSDPGDYILRAIARQGREQTDVLVHVKVTP